MKLVRSVKGRGMSNRSPSAYHAPIVRRSETPEEQGRGPRSLDPQRGAGYIPLMCPEGDKDMTELEGWVFLINSKKWHYFVDGESLCSGWMYWGKSLDDFQKGNNDSPDNCAKCKKKLLARDAQQRNEADAPKQPCPICASDEVYKNSDHEVSCDACGWVGEV